MSLHLGAMTVRRSKHAEPVPDRSSIAEQTSLRVQGKKSGHLTK